MTSIQNLGAHISSENYNKQSSPGVRKLMAQLIQDNMELIVEKGGGILLSARQVLDILNNEGILSRAGIHLVGANSVGDVLGKKRFLVPMMVQGATRKYLIPAVNWTAEEKQEFEQLSPDERGDRLKQIQDRLLKAPEESVREMVDPEEEEIEDEEDA